MTCTGHRGEVKRGGGRADLAAFALRSGVPGQPRHSAPRQRHAAPPPTPPAATVWGERAPGGAAGGSRGCHGPLPPPPTTSAGSGQRCLAPSTAAATRPAGAASRHERDCGGRQSTARGRRARDWPAGMTSRVGLGYAGCGARGRGGRARTTYGAHSTCAAWKGEKRKQRLPSWSVPHPSCPSTGACGGSGGGGWPAAPCWEGTGWNFAMTDGKLAPRRKESAAWQGNCCGS